MGPPSVASPVNLLYAGRGVFCPVSENGRASTGELSIRNPRLPLYRHLPGARLLPKAGNMVKGELAALFTLPLTRKPSAARRETSAETQRQNRQVPFRGAGRL